MINANLRMKAWYWLVRSSEDPQKFSLTVKGILTALATWAALAAGVVSFGMPPMEQVNGIIDVVVNAVNLTLAAVPVVAGVYASWATVWGALRKVLVGRWAAPVWE